MIFYPYVWQLETVSWFAVPNRVLFTGGNAIACMWLANIYAAMDHSKAPVWTRPTPIHILVEWICILDDKNIRRMVSAFTHDWWCCRVMKQAVPFYLEIELFNYHTKHLLYLFMHWFYIQDLKLVTVVCADGLSLFLCHVKSQTWLFQSS